MNTAEPTTITSKSEDVDILSAAREHMRIVQIMESEIREEGKKCNSFLSLDQWDPLVKTGRGARPTLVIDQLGQFVDQVVNDIRRNRVGVKVSPADGPADKETAELLDGWIRQCEYQSKAHIAYDWAAECMTGINRGFLKLTTRRRPGTFKQDPWIMKIANPDCVYMDPFCQEADYSDQRRSLIVDRLSHSAFKQQYPRAAVTDFSGYFENADYANWITADAITVAEFWFVEDTPRKIQRLTKPISVVRNAANVQTDVVYDNEYEELPEGVEVSVNSDGSKNEDDEPLRKVWQYMLNGVEVLDKTLWPSQYIPLVPMLAKERYYDGKKRLFSLISRSLDAQQLFNYAQSSMAERLSLFPKNPVVGLTGQFKTDETQWAAMNSTLFPYLNYDPVLMPDGTYHVVAPQRADFDPRLDQHALVSQQQQSNIKSTMGVYGTNLGDHEGKVRSGAAERALQQEGNNATFDFTDNYGRAIELVGKILIDLSSKILAQPDIIQIRDAQDQVLQRAINQPLAKMQKKPEGQERDFDLTQGQYAVTVSAAPSHESLRSEGAEMSMEMFKVLPPEEQVKIAPVMLRLQNWYGAQEIADILDPPQKAGAIDPQVKAQMQKAQQVIDLQTKEIHRLNDDIATDKVKRDSDVKIADMKSQVEKFKIWADLKIAQMANNTKLGIATEQMNLDEALAAADREAQSAINANEHANAMEMQSAGADNAMQLAQTPPPADPNAAPQQGATQ